MGYVWCLVAVVIFMELGETKRAREVFIILGTSHKGGTDFCGGSSPL